MHTHKHARNTTLSLPLVLRVRLRRPLLVLCSILYVITSTFFWIIHTHFDARYYTHQSRRRREEKAALRRDDYYYYYYYYYSWSSFERCKARSLRGERHRRGPNKEDVVEHQLRRHRSDGSMHHHRDAKEWNATTTTLLRRLCGWWERTNLETTFLSRVFSTTAVRRRRRKNDEDEEED